MLHTKFQISELVREKIFDWFMGRFLKGFTIYGRGGHLGHVTQMPRTSFCSHYP